MDKSNWTYRKLGEVATFFRGLTYSKKDEVEQSSKMVLRANNIDLDTHTLNFDDIKCLNDAFEISEEKKLKTDTILMCMSSGSIQHLGKVAFVDKNYEYAFGGFMGLIAPNQELVFPKFLFFPFLSSKFQTIIHKEGKGVNINNLKFSDIKDFSIPVPPLPTQQRIVAELDCISTILEKKRQQLVELDNLAQAFFYDMFGDPVLNDMGWETYLFKLCFQLSSGQGLSAKNIINGSFPVYGGNGIVGYHNEYNIDGDNIIIGRVGALCGNVRNVIGKAFVTDNAFILSKKKDFNNVFLTNLLVLLNLRCYARDALQPVISNTTLKDIMIILPPFSLQQQFAKKIEAIERQKALISQSIKEMQTLFDCRMEGYFG